LKKQTTLNWIGLFQEDKSHAAWYFQFSLYHMKVPTLV